MVGKINPVDPVIPSKKICSATVADEGAAAREDNVEAVGEWAIDMNVGFEGDVTEEQVGSRIFL